MTAGRIVVTGANGAVGSEFLAHLADQAPDAELVAVFSSTASRDSFLGRVPQGLASALRCVVRDLGDGPATRALAAELGPARNTVLVHAAANVSWSATPQAAHHGNVVVTRHTAELARALGARFLYVSSAYTATENWLYRNTYEASKAEAERMLRAGFADLDLSVFSCSLVVGHSRTGEISRFHGMYPLLGLVERYEPPFLPGDRDARIDIVPVDWVAANLCTMTTRLLAGMPAYDVVASAGDQAPTLGELVTATVTVLNRARREQGRPELADVPLVPYRRWDFLRRSVTAWQVTQIRMPHQQFLERLVGIYRPYLETALVRPPQGVTAPCPGWSSYLDTVVEHWRARSHRPARMEPAR
ncbi:SDR family oxidoreductase [Kineosporia sp. J2-2]|uniref:SDR family oxidoreductase n=1 Tax=Kineosporia corallincola TaxID=2835133 RepID=A0ABS5TQE3_9ACTN|nr:SDR family oxidoreductase [Kineosporia corallincola]MBT0773326.1 SDR family oxidoreductase [Kineosporia corallincola]